MARGSGENGHPAAIRGSGLNALQRTIAARLRNWDSIRITDSGLLTDGEAGYPAGSPYVVIQADNAMNREIARDLLREHSGTTDLAWGFGWTGRELDNGRRVTELTLYPVVSPGSHVS